MFFLVMVAEKFLGYTNASSCYCLAVDRVFQHARQKPINEIVPADVTFK